MWHGSLEQATRLVTKKLIIRTGLLCQDFYEIVHALNRGTDVLGGEDDEMDPGHPNDLEIKRLQYALWQEAPSIAPDEMIEKASEET